MGAALLSPSDRGKLAERVARLTPDHARALRLPSTEAKRLETPFFRDAAVYRVTWVVPARPVVFTLGTTGAGATVLLAMNREGWAQLADSGVDLSTQELRLAYVRTFLETTRSFGKRFDVLHSVEELRPRGNLSPEQRAAFDATRDRYRERATPTISEGPPWRVRALVVKGQALVEVSVVVDASGKLQTTEKVLETSLLIPFSI